MNSNKGQLLLIEDDQEIGKLVGMARETNGYHHKWVQTGVQAKLVIESYRPDVILLDLGLPDIDGLEIIVFTRKQFLTPIIVISARDEETDKIKALDFGADDYLIKPFSINELLARVRVAFRRNAYLDSGKNGQETVYENGSLIINYDSHRVSRNGKLLHLTNVEYKLLITLASNSNRVLTHHYLLKHVWGIESVEDTSILRVAVATLRKKIDFQENTDHLIQTYIGVGYRLVKKKP